MAAEGTKAQVKKRHSQRDDYSKEVDLLFWGQFGCPKHLVRLFKLIGKHNFIPIFI